jgi:hypothetical protein
MGMRSSYNKFHYIYKSSNFNCNYRKIKGKKMHILIRRELQSQYVEKMMRKW